MFMLKLLQNIFRGAQKATCMLLNAVELIT